MRKFFKRAVKFVLFGKELKKEYLIGNIKHHNTIIDSLTPNLVTIGDNFISAPGSRIITHDASLFMQYNCYKVGAVTIGDNVFLGVNAVVMPGVTIGDNAIIGAGSIVTKDVPKGVVVVGNPAREICTVKEYYKKVKNSSKYIEAPDTFNKVRENKRLTHEDIYEFRDLVRK